MIDRLKSVVQKLVQPQQATEFSHDELKAAAVVLLVEVMMADHRIEEDEKRQLLESTMTLLKTTREESMEIIGRSLSRQDKLVSLYDLTRVINLHFTQDRKLELIEHMWRMAYSDREWDKYEEHLIRKVADLLYISHKDFIRARIQVQESLSNPS